MQPEWGRLTPLSLETEAAAREGRLDHRCISALWIESEQEIVG
jgi:hypothetical protein